MGKGERGIGALAGAVVAIGAAGCGGKAHRPPDLVAKVPLIAHRVERIRGERFKHVPRPRVVSPKQAEKEGLASLDRSYPARSRHADEEVLKLLGLLPRNADLRKLSGAVFGEQVAGYYDPRTKRLTVVRGARGFAGEVVLAHELTHALEDQRFKLTEGTAGTDDRSTADDALSEGTATAVMTIYTRRYVGAGQSLGDALGSLGGSLSGTALPRYIEDSLVFPYIGGLQFVEALRAQAHGSWRLVNAALTTRPPASTEQIMHPRAWLRREAPLPVRTGARQVLGGGGGWRRVAAGELGEWDTRELLLQSLDQVTAGAAAQGWGGGRYELWQRPGPSGCRAPCRRHDALVVAWRWDTPGDASAFGRTLLTWLPLHLKARPAGRGAWRVADGRAQVESAPRTTALAFAPTAALAARLAREAAR